MTGRVDDEGRALVEIELQFDGAIRRVEAWIDTGFTGDLTLPTSMIAALKLRPRGQVKGILADGSEVLLPTFACIMTWFDSDRDIEIIANSGQFPLIGVGLLLGRDLIISYRDKSLSIK